MDYIRSCSIHIILFDLYHSYSSYIGGETIPTTPTLRLLGVTLDHSLTFKTHVQQTSDQARKRNNITRVLTSRQAGLQKEELVRVYKAITRSVIEYAAPAWTPTLSETSWKTLQVQQNEGLRIATGCLKMTAIDHLHQETRVLPVKEHCTLKTAQFGAKATEIHHPNNIDYKRTNCRGIKNTIESTRLNCFQAFDIDEEQPATIQSKQLHTNIVKSTISQYHPNKLINKPPPKPPDKVDILERGLSRADRVLLAQLRSNYCSSLKQYRTRVGLSNDPTCPRCKKEEETTIHALECRGIDPILLWEAPADVIAKW